MTDKTAQWKKGQPSPNPAGRRLQTAASKSIKGAIDRFLVGKIKARALDKLYNELPATGKLEMLSTFMPYRFPRMSAVAVKTEIMNADAGTIDELFNRLVQSSPTGMSIEDILAMPDDQLPKSVKHE